MNNQIRSHSTRRSLCEEARLFSGNSFWLLARQSKLKRPSDQQLIAGQTKEESRLASHWPRTKGNKEEMSGRLVFSMEKFVKIRNRKDLGGGSFHFGAPEIDKKI